jgi:hypothetical protein
VTIICSAAHKTRFFAIEARCEPKSSNLFCARTSAAFGVRLHLGFAAERRKPERDRIQELKSEPSPCLIKQQILPLIGSEKVSERPEPPLLPFP